MIKLPKKIEQIIKNNFSEDVTIIKEVYIHSMYKELCVRLVAFRMGESELQTIMIYFGDNSYSFHRGFTPEEVAEEMAYQVQKLY